MVKVLVLGRPRTAKVPSKRRHPMSTTIATSRRDRLMDEMKHLTDVVGLEDLTVPSLAESTVLVQPSYVRRTGEFSSFSAVPTSCHIVWHLRLLVVSIPAAPKPVTFITRSTTAFFAVAVNFLQVLLVVVLSAGGRVTANPRGPR
jgi:hypothetical protein